MYRIVLVEPESPGNIGFIARIMENFGMDELVLVDPQCELDETARTYAVHAQETLKRARIVDSLEAALDGIDVAFGTTGVKVTEQNTARAGVRPDQAVSRAPEDVSIAAVFGREGTGLTNEELDQCDFVVHIPTTDAYPVMNLSHAVAVICYELAQTAGKNVHEQGDALATRQELEAVEKLFKSATDKLDWGQSRSDRAARSIRNMLGRSYATGPEIAHVLGLLRDVGNAFDADNGE